MNYTVKINKKEAAFVLTKWGDFYTKVWQAFYCKLRRVLKSEPIANWRKSIENFVRMRHLLESEALPVACIYTYNISGSMNGYGLKARKKYCEKQISIFGRFLFLLDFIFPVWWFD